MKEMSKAVILAKKSVTSINFERELLCRLNHPFICNICYAFQDTENLYLVIELANGGDLRYHLFRNIKFDETKVGNDAWFSLQVGYWAKNVEIDYTPIYDWMIRNGSITSNKGLDAILTHIKLLSRLNNFKEAHNLEKYRSNIFAFIPMLVRANVPIYSAVGICIKNTSTKYILKDIINVIKMNFSK